MSSAYSISAPVDFTNTTAGSVLNFFADATASENVISNFIGTAPGDLLVRAAGNANVLDRIAPGAVDDVLTMLGTTTAGVYTITTVADVADSLSGTYFTLNSPDDAFYFWFDTGASVDPGTVQPIPSDLLIDGVLKSGQVVSITTNDTDVAVATALDAVIDALGDFNTVLAAPLITVTNAVAGSATDPVDGVADPTGFTIGTTTSGSSPMPAWSPAAPGSPDQSFMATGNTPVATAIASGATWVDVDDNVITWDTSAVPNHDDGSNFTTATGAFTVPATGIYTISCALSFEGNNTGVPATIAGRRAVRQARVRNTSDNSTVAFGEAQAQASELNPTQVNIGSAGALLTVGDVVVVQARHDASVALALNAIESTGSGAPAIVFSAARIA